jgi:hypothetical protein
MQPCVYLWNPSISSNSTDQVHKYTIYPYIHSFSNAPDHASILRPITVPDILPSSLPAGSDFSLIAGDSLQVTLTCDFRSVIAL